MEFYSISLGERTNGNCRWLLFFGPITILHLLALITIDHVYRVFFFFSFFIIQLCVRRWFVRRHRCDGSPCQASGFETKVTDPIYE